MRGKFLKIIFVDTKNGIGVSSVATFDIPTGTCIDELAGSLSLP
jgi:hypothetical protein